MSDIHANGDALNVVLAKCQELKIDHYVSLGDIVGYNAEPSYCLQTVLALPLVRSVKGNHDSYASGGDGEIEGFNPNARTAVLWTRSQLTNEERIYLQQLPYKDTLPAAGINLVHATLDSPQNWGYIFDEHHAADNFSYQFTPLCFCGHSHVPVAFIKKPFTPGDGKSIEEDLPWGNIHEDFTQASEVSINIMPGYKYLLNVGSIGQPRNQDPRASFAVYDTDEHRVTRYKLPYDIESAQRKILEVGLPERLAMRLALGR